MTIPGTLRCERIKTPGSATCACGWVMRARSQKHALHLFHEHLRLVRASLRQKDTA